MLRQEEGDASSAKRSCYFRGPSRHAFSSAIWLPFPPNGPETKTWTDSNLLVRGLGTIRDSRCRGYPVSQAYAFEEYGNMICRGWVLLSSVKHKVT
ncbi:hypothetical protein CDAR_604131 [Caerostris darwini]|uniref:Uncharacterized protein n=1 Tax=Caerostris darwini TaxID=1538125 RepID=A0AAV4QN67_9ARAC|nr:hypothetical protein CDAR_604131 [Caerostris darwini]